MSHFCKSETLDLDRQAPAPVVFVMREHVPFIRQTLHSSARTSDAPTLER